MQPRSSYCTVRVTELLVIPPKLACTVIVVPTVALPEMVPVPLPWVNVRSVVSELIQVTDDVMSCWPLVPGKTARALNVTFEAGVGVVVETLRVMEVGVPWLTVTVVVAAATVPEAALIVVVQTPVTVLAGVTKPAELMLAHAGVPELHSTLPVRFCCDPSL